MTLDALCISLSSQIFLYVNVIREAFKCSHSLARSQPKPLNQIFGDNNLFFSNTIDENCFYFWAPHCNSTLRVKCLDCGNVIFRGRRVTGLNVSRGMPVGICSQGAGCEVNRSDVQ